MLYRLVALFAAGSMALGSVINPRTRTGHLATRSKSLPKGMGVSRYYGGPGGNEFSDLDSKFTDENTMIQILELHGGKRLDSFAYTVKKPRSDATTVSHGGTGGRLTALRLKDGDYISEVYLCWGEARGSIRILYIRATTMLGDIVDAGQQSGTCNNANIPVGHQVIGVSGRAGNEVDGLAFYYVKAPPRPPPSAVW